MKTLLTQIKWQFVLLNKNKLIAISVIVTALYALLFFLLKDLPNKEAFLTLLIYNDPAIIGLFFIGLGVILENNSNVLPALFVTPINYHVYVLARVLALSVIGLACSVGMALAILGTKINWLEFSVGVLGTCVLFSLVGLFVVSYTMDFLGFMLRSIPLLALMSLPLLNYFGVTETALFEFLPTQGPLNLTIAAFGSTKTSLPTWLSCLSMVLWIPLVYLFVYRIFVQRVVKSK